MQAFFSFIWGIGDKLYFGKKEQTLYSLVNDYDWWKMVRISFKNGNIEVEFFEVKHFYLINHFMQKATSYQLWFFSILQP